MYNTKKIRGEEHLWQLFEEYVKETKGNPIKVHDFVGQLATEVHRKKERPLTMGSFEVFVSKREEVRTLVHYFNNTAGKYEEYIEVCEIIKKVIQADQIEGALAGIYNSNLTARLNGLTDKTESKVTATVSQITGMEVK